MSGSDIEQPEPGDNQGARRHPDRRAVLRGAILAGGVAAASGVTAGLLTAGGGRSTGGSGVPTPPPYEGNQPRYVCTPDETYPELVLSPLAGVEWNFSTEPRRQNLYVDLHGFKPQAQLLFEFEGTVRDPRGADWVMPVKFGIQTNSPHQDGTQGAIATISRSNTSDVRLLSPERGSVSYQSPKNAVDYSRLVGLRRELFDGHGLQAGGYRLAVELDKAQDGRSDWLVFELQLPNSKRVELGAINFPRRNRTVPLTFNPTNTTWLYNMSSDLRPVPECELTVCSWADQNTFPQVANALYSVMPYCDIVGYPSSRTVTLATGGRVEKCSKFDETLWNNQSIGTPTPSRTPGLSPTIAGGGTLGMGSGPPVPSGAALSI